MKTKASKQPSPSKPAVQVRDLKAKKNPKGGQTKTRSNVFAVWVTTGF